MMKIAMAKCLEQLTVEDGNSTEPNYTINFKHSATYLMLFTRASTVAGGDPNNLNLNTCWMVFRSHSNFFLNHRQPGDQTKGIFMKIPKWLIIFFYLRRYKSYDQMYKTGNFWLRITGEKRWLQGSGFYGRFLELRLFIPLSNIFLVST